MPELTVLTLNIWGLWLVSKQREKRIKCLAEYLKTCTEDIVLLQEVWIDGDAQQLIRAGKAAGLKHCTHFRSGRFGSGLVTLSRHPIIRHGYWRYASAGYATAISCGDFYAGKGVGWVRLTTPLGEVDVFNTHLHANYCHEFRTPSKVLCRSAAAAAAAMTGTAALSTATPQPPAADGFEEVPAAVAATAAGSSSSSSSLLLDVPAWPGSRIPDDDDACTRISQMMELSELVDVISNGSSSSSSSAGGRLLVVGGDLNCEPDTLEMDLFRVRLPQLADAWATAAQQGGSSTGGTDGNPEGLTCHAPGNTYQPRRQVAERIDYIWSNLACRRAEVALQMSPAGISYSDHFAVRAVLEQHALESSSTAAAGDSVTSKLGPMKLRGIFGKKSAGSAETAAPGSGGTSLQPVADSAASTAQLSVDCQVATAMAATLLLEEGIKNFSSGAGIITAVGGFLLAAVVYSAAAVPVLLPDVAFQGVWVSLVVLAVGLVAAAGVALLLIGGIADRSQQRALQNSYRQLLVWMEQQFGVVQDVGAAAAPMT